MAAGKTNSSPLFALLWFAWWLATFITTVPAAESGAQNNSAPAAVATNSAQFTARSYELHGAAALTTNVSTAELQKFTGTNLTITNLVSAATYVRGELENRGQTNVSVSISPREITNGVVTLNVFRALHPQILVAGRTFAPAMTLPSLAAAAAGTAASATKTNTGPHFTVKAYEIYGDTLLTTEALTAVLGKHTGTNVTIGEIVKAATELQMEYRERGYPTVSVTIPQQQITNEMVKLRVFEGRLADISITGNRFFSSNNIMRTLPGLHTNMIIRGPVLQAEVDRANANQDRQIYPEIGPGPEPNTTDIRLRVKDRLPLHAKVEFNNQSSPGTPELRLNTSAVYDNLWQVEHSFGVQYSFSPETYKTGDQWAFYDRPLVANYSAFYRLPLGNPEAIADTVATQPGSFGFNEATRQFRLPPPSGRSELNFFASRSTIDSGLETLQNEIIYDVPGVRQVSRQDVQQDLTLNEDVGMRWSQPLAATDNWRSTVSAGLDFKTYSLTSYKTNTFSFTEITVNANGTANPPIISSVASPVPPTHRPVDYAPVSLRYDGTLRDKLGTTTFGLGFVFNAWYSGSPTNLQNITGSSKSTGYWVAFTPSLSRDFLIHTNWVLSLRADGQWASEPLISPERFGVGGVNSVRGYREGEVFGDTGWHISLEQKTPPYVIGITRGRTPLTVRGAVYMDYADTFLLDPNGAKGSVSLWGYGFGGIFSLGTHWEARFLFSVPLLSAGTTEAHQPRFNFSLIGQF